MNPKIKLFQLEEITQRISINNEYINWKSFLLLLSKPFPEPTYYDLHQSLNILKSRDHAGIGMITREDFLEVLEHYSSYRDKVKKTHFYF